MIGRSRWTQRLLFVAASLSAAGAVQAQTVMVQVLGAETSEPLIGAIAHLVLPLAMSGQEVGRILVIRREP